MHRSGLFLAQNRSSDPNGWGHEAIAHKKDTKPSLTNSNRRHRSRHKCQCAINVPIGTHVLLTRSSPIIKLLKFWTSFAKKKNPQQTELHSKRPNSFVLLLLLRFGYMVHARSPMCMRVAIRECDLFHRTEEKRNADKKREKNVEKTVHRLTTKNLFQINSLALFFRLLFSCSCLPLRRHSNEVERKPVRIPHWQLVDCLLRMQ